MKNNFTSAVFFLSFLFCLSVHAIEERTAHYYCTATDEKHFDLLVNLIGSIHQVDFNHLDEIAVFNLGLNENQINTLRRMEKVAVYEVEKVHPDILTYFLTASYGKQVRGWYAWKPVVMKQALDKFPFFMYLDSGSLVLTSPDNLFRHIEQNGYFFIDVFSHNIIDRLTWPAREKFVWKLPIAQQDTVLDSKTYMIAGGVQGLSRAIKEEYIMPLYDAASDLSIYADDGTAPMGFGEGRHDQTLMSIMVRSLGYKIHNGNGWSNLCVNREEVPFHYHWDHDQVNDRTCIYSCRVDGRMSQGKAEHIRWK